MLEGLANNHGTVFTSNILPGSALIDAGNSGLLPADTTDIDNDGNTTEPLPIDANGLNRVSGIIDIGAVESFSHLIVDTISDNDDGDISTGNFSLREALARVHGGGTITFAPELANQKVAFASGIITKSLTIDGEIDGDGEADVTIDGNNSGRIFKISGGPYADVTLHGLILTGGSTGGGSYRNGAAVFANTGSSVTIINSSIINNSAAFGSGGGVAADNASLSLVNVLMSGNSARYNGGASSFAGTSTATFTNTTIYGNETNGRGGGISIFGTSSVTLNNSTVSGNLAYANSPNAFPAGGGVYNQGSGILNLYNTVIAQNTSGGLAAVPLENDIRSTSVVTNATNSFVGVATTITNDHGGNINGGGDASLGELLDNGGTTLTLSPLDGSVLIDAGNNGSIPTDSADIDNDGNDVELLPLDGRGGLRIVSGTVDIGAVEQIEDETIRGTNEDNNIIGGLGDDVLTGLAGADNIDGGAHGAIGDTASFAGSTAAVQINLDAGTASGGHAAGDVLTNIENLIGSSFGDILTGTNGANFIDGALGNDTLNGLDGDDVLIGGFNQDTLNGGDGDDDLDGRAGNDIIDGGTGTDTGRFDSFGGAVIINLNLTSAQNTGAAGTDTITNVENLIGGIGNDRFIGKLGVSVFDGGGGSDSLFGLGGNDILNGGDGNDNAQGGNGADTLTGGNGRDTLVGGNGIDTLQGDDGKDVIRGGNDEDAIDGGAGRDVLIGGDFTGGGFPGDGAADTFVFSDVSHSTFGGATRDIIRDFEQTLDVIDLSAIDAIIGGGDDAFTFIGTVNFSGAAGELRAFSIGGNTTVRADVDGDGAADFEIFLNGTIAMATGDFVL